MSYEELSNRNMSEGLQVLLVYTNDITNGLMVNLILFSFFLIILFGGYFSQKRTSGTGDFWAFLTIAGFVTTILAMIMSFIPQLVNSWTLATLIAITVVGVIGLYFNKRE